MLHVNAAERADSVVGRCSLVEALAERGLFFLCQRIASIAASLIVQPVQTLSIVALHPELNVASRKIKNHSDAGSREALGGQDDDSQAFRVPSILLFLLQTPQCFQRRMIPDFHSNILSECCHHIG